MKKIWKSNLLNKSEFEKNTSVCNQVANNINKIEIRDTKNFKI